MRGPPSCPRCSGSMEAGYLLDEGYGKRGPIKWIQNAPEFSMWTGLKLGGRQNIQVATYRCRQWGYLESYANDDD